eukprot:scaffold363_cov255-Pinguiococcus_pyrenoidosus.AAC.12
MVAKRLNVPHAWPLSASLVILDSSVGHSASAWWSPGALRIALPPSSPEPGYAVSCRRNPACLVWCVADSASGCRPRAPGREAPSAASEVAKCKSSPVRTPQLTSASLARGPHWRSDLDSAMERWRQGQGGKRFRLREILWRSRISSTTPQFGGTTKSSDRSIRAYNARRRPS